MAVELYAGADMTKKHKFVEPTTTDHLIFAIPSAGAKEIQVKAADRFGNIFTDVLMLQLA
jgi:hypothetical protein